MQEIESISNEDLHYFHDEVSGEMAMLRENLVSINAQIKAAAAHNHEGNPSDADWWERIQEARSIKVSRIYNLEKKLCKFKREIKRRNIIEMEERRKTDLVLLRKAIQLSLTDEQQKAIYKLVTELEEAL